MTTDTSALTSVANDNAFEYVFSNQVMEMGRPGDFLVCISNSGNSKNFFRAVEEAKAIGMTIVVPSDVTVRIQYAHILTCHTLCGLIKKHLGLA